MYTVYSWYHNPTAAVSSPVATPYIPVAAPAATEPLLPFTFAEPPILTPLTFSRKRGSEELMSHSPMVTNGTALSPQHGQGADMANDAKKVKLDSAGPSRVVHIRSLPPDAAETDIVQLGMPFGKMTNVLLLKQKNQAFLEFQDEAAAANMVTYYQSNPAQVRLRQVYVQYSNHKELKTDQSHQFQNATAQAALQAAQAVMVGGGEEQTTILRVIIDNILYPVTLDVLHQLFSRFGKVLKLITFTKNNTFQALIQFSDPISATTAKGSLDGQNIYNGCNTLKIDYSKLTQLNVKYNNDKSRDFTRPDLPSGDMAIDQLQLSGTPGVMTSPLAAVPGFGAQPLMPYGAAAAAGGMTQPFVFELTNAAAAAEAPAFVSLEAQADAFPHSLLHPSPVPAYGGLAGQMPMAGFGMPGAGFGAAGRMGMPGMAPQTGTSVILVSNLDEEMVTPEALFTLFGVYGDVHRVKILFNKKDNALIQMADPHQAQLCIQYLDKVRVWGKTIRVTQSKHSLVQMPKEGQPDAGLTKDFTSSPLHRFKRPGSKNCQNIFAPSAVLHLSNIPPSVSEEELKELFSQHGSVTGFKFFPKDRKMALIQMSSVDEAILALMALHNYQLSENSHLRVSFSKSTI